LRPAFDKLTNDVLGTATLSIPTDNFTHKGGKTGTRHTEHLGHMIATMQFLPRAYPDAKW
jgi:ring-1,2-phenylacetyl-CoA epoxidase subunit PaaC